MKYCGSCRELCVARVIDEGVGPYEFWGKKGVDTQLIVVSDCCEESVYKNEELTKKYTIHSLRKEERWD